MQQIECIQSHRAKQSGIVDFVIESQHTYINKKMKILFTNNFSKNWIKINV